LLLESAKFADRQDFFHTFFTEANRLGKEAGVLPLENVKAQIAAQIRQNLINSQFFSVEKRVAEKAFEDPSSLKAAADKAAAAEQQDVHGVFLVFFVVGQGVLEAV